MANEKEHKLEIINRQELEFIGVTEVLNYDESKINLETDQGSVLITGEDLHIKHLDLEQLKLEVTGYITSFQYESETQITDFFKRLFK